MANQKQLRRLLANLQRNGSGRNGRRGPQRSRRRRQVQPAQNSQMQAQLNKLTTAVSMLAVKTKQPGDNTYQFFRGQGQDVPNMPNPPALDTDLRFRASKEGIQQMAVDVKAAFSSGAGQFTVDPTGKVTFHLQFKPLRASDIHGGGVPSIHLNDVSSA
nr:putative nucleocapsid protein [Serpentovirales sp.]